jgi:hypothetical protein
VTAANGRPTRALRPLRLSLGNAPPLDVPARFIALGGVSMVAGCVLIAIWADQVVAPGGWATPQALAVTHVLALGFVTAVMSGVLYQMLPVVLGARARRASVLPPVSWERSRLRALGARHGRRDRGSDVWRPEAARPG